MNRLAAWYLVASVVAYVAYFRDKVAAARGTRRTPERTLHLLGLAGGWPGAWVAQRQFRHKTAKRSFQWLFRATALGNLALLGWWAAATP